MSKKFPGKVFIFRFPDERLMGDRTLSRKFWDKLDELGNTDNKSLGHKGRAEME